MLCDTPKAAHAIVPEVEPFDESLAMTEELQQALFPKTTQMVSAIFDRPPPLERRPASPPPAPAAGRGSSFPIIF
jgi:hypothetical protein